LGHGDSEDQLGRAGELEVEVGGDGAFHGASLSQQYNGPTKEGFVVRNSKARALVLSALFVA
jgi:hypothetical protein